MIHLYVIKRKTVHRSHIPERYLRKNHKEKLNLDLSTRNKQRERKIQEGFRNTNCKGQERTKIS